MQRRHQRICPNGTQTTPRTRRTPALLRWAALAACGCAAFLLLGCADLALPLPEPTPAEPEKPLIQPTPELAAEADQAFSARNMPLAELLYSRLLEREDLDRAGKLMALDRIAQTAFANRHYYQAKQALDRQASLDNGVLALWPWHEIYIKTLGALDRPDLVDNHQAWLAAHTELPYPVRARGAMAFSEIYGRGGDFVRAVNVLARTHKQAPDRAAKAAFEAEYAQALRELPEQQILGLARLIGSAGEGAFPHTLIRREAARRQGPALRSDLRPGAPRPELAPVEVANAAAFSGSLLAQAQAKATRSDQPGLLPAANPNAPVRLALALPLSGRFAPTGWKVLRGAAAAQARLEAQGRKVEIKTVNTEAADWRDQLSALPPDFRILGGPLQVENFKALEAAGVTAQRAVFAFVPDLGGGQVAGLSAGQQEGKTAWRFFTSPRDQVRALIDITVDKVGIRSVAVLAPRNRYGQRMAEIFTAEAKAKGLRVASSGTYPPDDHPRWKQSVAALLKVPEGFRGNKNIPLPMPDFGAVFVPEDWANAEMLVSNFHFYEGEHLLFLGPELWSVALDNAHEVDDTYFQQAVCPGAWWPESAGAKALQAALDRLPAQSVPGSAASQQLTGPADFWVGLGHDFVQLAARLNLAEAPGQLDPAQVNAQLAELSRRGDLPLSLAPMAWDAEGRASQTLYLFAPRKEGKALVDAAELRSSFTKAKERRERRIVTSKEVRKAKEAAKQ